MQVEQSDLQVRVQGMSACQPSTIAWSLAVYMLFIHMLPQRNLMEQQANEMAARLAQMQAYCTYR